jgi:chromosome segregation ATPase
MENKQAVATYERNVKELKDVKAQLTCSAKGHSKAVKKMKKLRDEWLPMVTAMTDKINNKFMAYFKEIHEHGYQCAGEVELTGQPCAAAADGAEDLSADKDFSTFGMDIKVKFRKDQELETLTGEVQSGGERALATFLYLLAMQEMTNCPFRVVDEINQGMDPTKERLAFHRLLDTTCRAKLPQYFLITPKLLQDLEFTDDVTVLVIFNGPWAPPQAKWDIKKFCKRRRNFESCGGSRKKKAKR